MNRREAIPDEWIKDYTGKLLVVAAALPQGPMRDAVLLRIDHAYDLVKACRESLS